MTDAISVERIREASGIIDPEFLDTPQFVCEPLSQWLGVAVLLKVECVNPIRSFKGRGAGYFVHTLANDPAPLVCASAGNFGQGMAFACRKAGRPLTVFAATSANPLKVARMRALGAKVVEAGADFDEAKDAARRHAAGVMGARFVEDGREPAISEGAGTIAPEILRSPGPLDAVFVPLGNGALVNGMGTWLKRFSSGTRVVGVCPEGAPSMVLSWMAGLPVEAPSRTIADGIAVRVPVPEALAGMRETVDEVALVSDDAMLEAMRRLHADTGLVVEPSGAAGLAAIAARRDELAGRRVATVLTGGNLTAEQVQAWLY